MPTVRSKDELAALFEDAWLLAELAAASADRRMVPQLIALAEDILAWRNRADDAPESPSVAGADPRDMLDELEKRLARQRDVVARLVNTGGQECIALGRELLRLMQEAVEIARRQHRLAATAERDPQVWRRFLTTEPDQTA